MPMPSDEYLRALQGKLYTIINEVSFLTTDIESYLGSARNTEDLDHLIRTLRDVQEELTGNWPKEPNSDTHDPTKVRFERPLITVSAGEAVRIAKEREQMQRTDTSRFDCGPHAVLITPGDINSLPPFKVTVWLNADKGNTSHNPKFMEIKSSKTFKTRGAAYEYGSHLCRRANTRSS